MDYGTIVLMETKQKKHGKKRKNSSEGYSVKTSKSNKEAKTGGNKSLSG